MLGQRVDYPRNALVQFLQPGRFLDDLAPVAQAVFDLSNNKMGGIGREFDIFGRVVEINRGDEADITFLLYRPHHCG